MTDNVTRNQLRFGTRGTVTGPATDGDETRLSVAFEGSAKNWNLSPTNLSQTDVVVCQLVGNHY